MISIEVWALANYELPEGSIVANFSLSYDNVIENIPVTDQYEVLRNNDLSFEQEHAYKIYYFMEKKEDNFLSKDFSNLKINFRISFDLNDDGLKGVAINEKIPNAYLVLKQSLKNEAIEQRYPFSLSNTIDINNGQDKQLQMFYSFSSSQKEAHMDIIKFSTNSLFSNPNSTSLLRDLLNINFSKSTKSFLNQGFYVTEKVEESKISEILLQDSRIEIEYSPKNSNLSKKFASFKKHLQKLTESAYTYTFSNTTNYDLKNHNLQEIPSNLQGIYFPEKCFVKLNIILNLIIDDFPIVVNWQDSLETDKNVYDDVILQIKKPQILDNVEMNLHSFRVK